MRWTETRECRRLTWPARLLLFAVIIVLLVVGARHLHPFLAPTEPLGGDYLVIEGVVGDYGLAEAVRVYRRGNYRKVLVTGAQLHHGDVLGRHRSIAAFAAKTLKQLGMDEDIMVVISNPEVTRNRTYRSAIAVRDWFRAQGISAPRLDLASQAAHSARSRLLYQMALGDEADIGVIALPRNDYDPDHWWRTNAGLRSTVTEFLAWIYARFFFYP